MLVTPAAPSRGVPSCGSIRPDREERPPSSEIERFQYKYDSSNWVFYLFAALAIVFYFGAASVEDWIGAAMIEMAAFHSVYLWAKRKVLGMPIMPVFAMLCLVYYGLPFVSGHPVTADYSVAEKLFAAATVAAVLFIMTSIWARLAKPATPHWRVVKTLVEQKGAISVLMACLVAAISFQSNLLFYFFSPSSELFGVMRAVLLTLGLLSIFCLAYLHGSGTLRAGPKYLFVALAVSLIAYHALSLYLVIATQYALVATLGYFLGSGRVPWKFLTALLAVLIVLQAGKADMRLKHSEQEDYSSTAVALIADWLGTGLENLVHAPSDGADEAVPLIQRVSLLQILLKTQTEAPEDVPYLYGSTYLQIPLLIVPRVIWPDRPNTSETLLQLNEHYGLLTRESAESTSIGWGMIAEANANFGFLGCIGIAIVLGTLLGLVQRLCGRYPALSARGMAGLLTMYAVLGMELSMAQFLTVLAQALVALLLLAWTVMQPRRVVV